MRTSTMLISEAFLGFVRSVGCVGSRLDLHDVERLARDEHHPLAIAIDELNLKVVHVFE
jgi:hypothetical protein